MNEHVPDSSGLPLRAMVMVLLFLGVIFLLLGWQAVGSSGNSDDESVSTATTTSTTAPPPTSTKTAAKPEVWVFNITEEVGLASRTRDKLQAAGWTVPDVGDFELPGVAVTTVYFDPDVAGEHEAADAVAKVLGEAQVEPRTAEVNDQPAVAGKAGLIVVVTSLA